ncbi:MAG: polysaccharide deacetylase family protein [Myxococcota bacterium]
MSGSLAESLGFEADDRVAVVHVDDLGMCHAANEGGFQALENGPATCGSVMVPCPWFAEAARRARAEPAFDLGVHLTLNSEWEHYRWGPVAGRSAVPSLLDDEGFLPRTTLETVGRAKPEEVELELRAQIEHALEAGVDVTHLDSHMGTCFFPPFIEVYARLARDFRLPVFAVRPDEEALARAGIRGALGVIRELVDSLENDGVPILDAFDANSLDFPEGEGEVHNRARLRGLRSGVNYLICHAAQGGEELRAITPDSAHQRDFEHRFYGGEAGRRALEAAGIRTVGMRAIRELMRA